MFETSDMCFVMRQTCRLERICGYMKKIPYCAVPDYNSSKRKGLLVVIVYMAKCRWGKCEKLRPPPPPQKKKTPKKKQQTKKKYKKTPQIPY